MDVRWKVRRQVILSDVMSDVWSNGISDVMSDVMSDIMSDVMSDIMSDVMPLASHFFSLSFFLLRKFKARHENQKCVLSFKKITIWQ